MKKYKKYMIFYDNLYESWANDEYIKLFFSKEEINKHIYSKTIYKP